MLVTAALSLLAGTVMPASLAFGAGLTPEQAAAHAGETATVCGLVLSVHYSSAASGPTLLRLGNAGDVSSPHPDHEATAVILSKDRPEIGIDPERLLNKPVCISGKIKLREDGPEIVLHERDQLQAP
jgi:hypothetical protein